MLKTITITGNSIPLPKTLAKKWQGKRVQLDVSDTMVVIQSQAAADAWQRIQAAPKKLIRPAAIQREIVAARREARQ